MTQKRCPKCNKIMSERPAISRVDNRTEICEFCGTEEALQDMMGVNKSPLLYQTITTVLTRKSANKSEIEENTNDLITNQKVHPEQYRIAYIIELSPKDFEYFEENLLQDNEEIAKHYQKCDEPDKVILIKEKGKPNESGIAVDPQGYKYARYTGIPIGEDKETKDISIYTTGKKKTSIKIKKNTLQVEEKADKLGYKVRTILYDK